MQKPNALLHKQHTKHGIIGNPTKFSAINKSILHIFNITWIHINIPATNGAYFKNITLSLCNVFIYLIFKHTANL